MLDIAVFTDTLPSESIDGTAGFTFQAISPGVTGGDRQYIIEHMLHEVYPAWDMNHDPLTHPPSACFRSANSRDYLARGRSTGTTNNGRRGNQLTQILIADSGADTDGLRPAQILRAQGIWPQVKAPTSTLEPLPRRVTTERAEDLLTWAASDPRIMRALPAFLTLIDSALHEAGTRAVLIHRDIETFLRWVALASVLMTDDEANRLTFRGLTADPWEGRWRLIGVSPDFEPDLAHTAHMDLRTLECTVTQPSRLATQTARWVQEHSPFTALALVDLARRWRPALGDDGAILAAKMAQVVAPPSGREGWEAGIRSIEGLARAGLREDLDLYFEEFTDPIYAHHLTSRDDFERAGRAAAMAMEAGLDDLASAILLPSLEYLTLTPHHSQGWLLALGVHAPWRWPVSESRDAFAAHLQTLLQDAPDDVLPNLLVMAQPLGDLLDRRLLVDSLQRTVLHALRTPTALETVEHWYAADQIIAWTSQGLDQRLTAHDPTSVHALRTGAWDDFITSHAPQLECWHTAAELGAVAPAKRAKAIEAAGTVSGRTWAVALHGVDPATAADPWIAWLDHEDGTSGAAAYLVARIEAVLREPPERAHQRWRPLVEAMVRHDPRATDLHTRYAEHLASIDTLTKRTMRMLGLNRHGQDADDPDEPPPATGRRGRNRDDRQPRPRRSFGEP